MSVSVPRNILAQQTRQVKRISWLNQHHPAYLLDRRRKEQAVQWRTKCFSTTHAAHVVKPYLLADIGEGITECQIIQWFVQPGAHVQQFDKICEVQSDKAAVEITSRFDGVIKKLHYEADDMARVGKPLVDIDIKGEIAPEDETLLKSNGDAPKAQETPTTDPPRSTEAPQPESSAYPQHGDTSAQDTSVNQSAPQELPRPPPINGHQKHKSLATPAVRHMIQEHNLRIEDVPGSGKDGRVLKEDVQRFAKSQSEPGSSQQQFAPMAAPFQPKTVPFQPATQPFQPATASLEAATAIPRDKIRTISGRQRKMYDTMTKSLSIPHFLYTDTVDFTSLNTVRRSINSQAASPTKFQETPDTKLSALPFIIKAISLSFEAFPSLNAHLETFDGQRPPQYTHKGSHNIGVAIDTPQGLIVPVLKNVQNQSILAIARDIARLSALARENKLSASDLSGATFTVSNIGSIGGTAVAPVIVSPQVAIVGVGKARAVPAFNEKGEVVRREECVFSWSADHRVVDGATVARCAEMVRDYLEGTERMLVRLR